MSSSARIVLAGRLRPWLLVVAIVAGASTARAADPALPPGQDPGGHAVALISTGIDYRDERIAARLARDGEGEMIAWDFVDEDRHPFAAAAPDATFDKGETDGTAAALALVSAYSRGRLVPVRVAPGADARSLARAIGFATNTPARVIAISLPVATAELREVVRQASERFRNHLFVVEGWLPADARGSDGAVPAPPLAPDNAQSAGPSTRPASANATNVLTVLAGVDANGRGEQTVAAAADLVVVPRGSTMFGTPPGTPPRNGAEAVALAAAAAACRGHARDMPLGSAAKAAVLETARPLDGAPSVFTLDPMCWYGGTRF